jgi:integrase
MQGRITKRSVDALRPDGAETVLWDSELKGFGVRVQKSAGKTYILKYRAGQGRNAPQRKYTIGKHGALTPDEARAEAKRLLALVTRGKDPAADKAAAKAAPTVAALAQRFLFEQVELKRKASTAREYHRLLDNVIVPALGRRKVADVTRTDVQRLHQSRRGTPVEANCALRLLSALFTFAERDGERPGGSNPCRYVERFPQKQHERFLSADEMARLGDVLASYGGSPYVTAAIKLLVFTGARLGEILGLQWEWVDFERGEARLPDSKTGAKTVHLPPPALTVLEALPRVEGNRYVIVGGIAGAALANLQKPWRAIRKAAGLEDVRLHDLRHAFASVGVASGMGLPIIGKLLGHSQWQTTQRYAHLASDPVKAAAVSIAGKIDAAMRSGKVDNAVVKLRSGA